jgi:hypothetical protein
MNDQVSSAAPAIHGVRGRARLCHLRLVASLIACSVPILSCGFLTATALEDETTTTSNPSDNERIRPSLSEWCHSQGFDSSQLACNTCEHILLPHLLRLQQREPSGNEAEKPLDEVKMKIINNCRQCCQSFRDVHLITEPYAAAVIVVPSRISLDDSDSLRHDPESGIISGFSSSELNDFFRDDYPALSSKYGSNQSGSNGLLVTILDDGTLSRQHQEKMRSLSSSMMLHPFYMMSSSNSPTMLYLLDYVPTAFAMEELQRTAKETIALDSWKRDEIRDMLSTLLFVPSAQA